jgi:hypothetical protein
MALTSLIRDFVLKSGLNVEGTSAVTSSTGQTGTIQASGGAAIAKNLIVGSTATVYGPTTLQNTLNVVGQSTLWQLTATITTVTQLTVMNDEIVYGSINVTGTSHLYNTLTVDGNSWFYGALNTFSGALIVTGTNTFTVGSGASDFGGTVDIGGVTSITDTTLADTDATGALVVSGGVYIDKNLIVASTSSNTGTNTQNALFVAGGLWVDRNLTVAGPAIFSDTVTFNGTATYVFSTNTFYTDNILELHTPPDGVYGKWPGGDGKDIGFRFHHFANNTDTNSALVLSFDTKYLEWYESGAESSTSTFHGATFGTFKTGSIKLTNTTTATSTSSGALTVAGGISASNLYSEGEIKAGTLKATDLISNNYGVVYSDPTGKLVSASNVSYDTDLQYLTGRIEYANTATNVDGGAAGSLLFQTSTGVTYSLPIGTNGNVLIVKDNLPYWETKIDSDYANTATNVKDGLANQIPYQTAPGVTGFSNDLQFNGTTFTTTNIVVTGNTNASNTYSGSLQVSGGVGISQDLHVGGSIYVGGDIFLDGVGLDTVQGTTATFVNINVTGTSYALTVTNGIYVGTTVTTDMMIVRNTLASTSTTTSNALYVVGGLGVGGHAIFGDSIRVGDNIIATNQISGIAGVFFGDQYGFGAIYAGTTNYVPLPSTVLQTTAYINDYAQNNFQNTSTGVTASTDWVATAGDGNDTHNYIDMGIVTANWDGTQLNSLGTALGANDGYLYVQGGYGGGNLVLGARATGTNVKIVAGGYGAEYTAAVFREPNVNATSTTTGTLSVVGGVGIGLDLFVGGTINVNKLRISGTENSTSTSSGALTVAGGIGIGGTLYAGDIYSNGALVSGGVVSNFTATTATVIADLTVNGKIITSLVTSTNTLTLSSNVGYNLNITAGGYQTTFLSSGTIRPSGALIGGNNDSNVVDVTSSTGALLLQGGEYGVQIVTSSSNYSWNFDTNGELTAPGNIEAPTVTVTSSTNATNTTSGSLQVTGGAGIGLDLFVGGAVHIGTTASNVVVPAVYSGNSLYASYTSNVITTSTSQNLDNFLTAEYRTAKYLVQITDTGMIHVQEMLLFQDGSNVYMSIYAITTNQGELGDFDASVVGGNTMTLTFTPNYVPTDMVIKVVRTTLTA